MPHLKFSILIPTRNRPEWLAKSLASALGQKHGSFEVVVVDNSDFGDNTTQKLLAEIDDPHLRALRTGGLGMAENWQAAVEAARGDFFLVCTDKLILAPYLLDVVGRALDASRARVVVWKIGAPTPWSSVAPAEVPSRMVPGDWIWSGALSGAWRVFSDAGARGMNSAIERTLVSEVQDALGVPFCRPATPDYSISLGLAALGHDSLSLDLVGARFIADAHGTGLLALMAPDDDALRKKFSFPEVRGLPVSYATGTNLIYRDILATEALVSKSAAPSAINWEMYFLRLIHEAVSADLMGGFSPARKKQLLAALADQTLPFRLALLKTMLQQEITNLAKPKQGHRFQIGLIFGLTRYMLPPIFAGLSLRKASKTPRPQQESP